MGAKSASIIIVGSLLIESLTPSCPGHDRVCDTSAEPLFTHIEIRSNDIRITNEVAVSGSGGRVDVTVTPIGLGSRSSVGSVLVSGDTTSAKTFGQSSPE